MKFRFNHLCEKIRVVGISKDESEGVYDKFASYS